MYVKAALLLINSALSIAQFLVLQSDSKKQVITKNRDDARCSPPLLSPPPPPPPPQTPPLLSPPPPIHPLNPPLLLMFAQKKAEEGTLILNNLSKILTLLYIILTRI